MDGPVISASSTAELYPFLEKIAASLEVTKDLPTPPFPLTIPITRFTEPSFFKSII